MNSSVASPESSVAFSETEQNKNSHSLRSTPGFTNDTESVAESPTTTPISNKRRKSMQHSDDDDDDEDDNDDDGNESESDEQTSNEDEVRPKNFSYLLSHLPCTRMVHLLQKVMKRVLDTFCTKSS